MADYSKLTKKELIMTLYARDLMLENERKQLHDLPKKIVKEIKLQLFNHFKVKNIEEYEKLPLIDSLFTADTVIEILDTILEKFGGERMIYDKEHCNQVIAVARSYRNDVERLEKQLAITEKALELACDYLISNGNEDDELYKLVQNIYDDDEYLATKINYFKTKAKEILDNE